jgi:SAM-dependent methyltransferase
MNHISAEPVIAHKSWKNASGVEHSGNCLDIKNGFEIIDCEYCKFKHAIPVPTAAELIEIYRHEYYSKEKPLYAERQLEDIDWWNRAYDDRFETLEAALPPNRRTIIDVGSGPGLFLKRGEQRGWNVLGVEPSEQAVSHARSLGLNVIEGLFNKASAQTLGKFDAVHMSLVLEHIPDPLEMLLLAKTILNDGGIICLEVPNDYNPFQRALTKLCAFPSWWVDPPHHLNYFNFESLQNLVERAGFKTLLKEATFPIDLFLLMGDNYIGNDPLGRSCHSKRKKMELNLDKSGSNLIKRELYARLAEIGIGREIVMYAVKL